MVPSRLALKALRRSIHTETLPCISRAQDCARSFQCSSSRLQHLRSQSSYIIRTSEPSVSVSQTVQAQQRRWQTSGRKVRSAKARYRVGVASPLAILLFIGTGVGLYFYFVFEKERMERKRIAEHSKGIGKPKVGAPFNLVDQEGQPWSSEKMKGKYALIYFGFSHCPDICPEELDKMAAMLSLVEAEVPSKAAGNPELVPVFITCDPARDTPEVLKVYLKEFDDRFIGLTGTWEQIKEVCKAYRVYFSTPPGVKPGQDYLVDHSIYFYLMDPDGDFVEAIGRQHAAEEGAKVMVDHMRDWKGPIVKG